MLDLEVSVNLRGLDEFLKFAEAELSDALDSAVFFMEGVAKQNAPIDAGFLRASIFSVTQDRNGAFASMSAAKARNPRGAMLSNFPIAHDRFEAFLVAGAEYAAIVNYGAFHIRGNTVRVGNRAGRIGTRLDSGEIATYVPGYLFMEEAIEQGRPVLLRLAKAGLASAKRRAKLA